MVRVRISRNSGIKAPKLRNSEASKKAVIAELMLRTAGNLAYASLQPEEMKLLDDVPMVIENVFTGKRFVRTGLEKALRFMADKGFTNGDNPAHADWYLYPLNA